MRNFEPAPLVALGRGLRTFLAALVLPVAAQAEAPIVVTDVAPVHSLVAQVMDGVGVPALLMEPGTNPHLFSLRPSQARTLSEADLVFWIGPELTPWLGKTMSAVARNAETVSLLDAEGTRQLAFREGLTFDGEAGAVDHDHVHAGVASVAGSVAPALADGTALVDPHAWLDPENARVWLAAIASALAARDPDNAGTYLANAAAASAELETLSAELATALARMQGRPLLTQHDAYRYFEARYDLHVMGAIRESDAADPSPKRVAALRDAILEHGVACVFTEPQFDRGLVDALAREAGVGLAELDPLGNRLERGPGLYAALLRALADDIARCEAA
jgi:zinc transport system substrate-binding protein